MPTETRHNVPLRQTQILNLKEIRIGTFIPKGKTDPTEVHLSVVIEDNEIPMILRFKAQEYLDEVITQLQDARDEVFSRHPESQTPQGTR